jgi:hypothetical protein
MDLFLCQRIIRNVKKYNVRCLTTRPGKKISILIQIIETFEFNEIFSLKYKILEFGTQ